MKFSFTKSDIQPALAFIKNVIREPDDPPILKNFLLSAEADRLTIFGHNLQRCASASCQVKGYDSGSLVVARERFTAIVQGFADAPIYFSVVGEGRAMLTQGRSRYPIPILPPGDYPLPLSCDGAGQVNLTEQDIAALFKRPCAVLYRDDLRPHCSGVFLHNRDGWLSSFATDGTRVLSFKSGVRNESLPAICIPRDLAADLAKLGLAMASWSSNVIKLNYENDYVLASRLLDYKCPDYSIAVGPREGQHLEFDLPKLTAALNRLAAVATHGSIISLNWSNPLRECTLRFERDGEGQETIPCQGNAEAGHIGFPPIRFSELLNTLSGLTVTLYLRPGGRPQRLVAAAEPDTIIVQAPSALFAQQAVA